MRLLPLLLVIACTEADPVDVPTDAAAPPLDLYVETAFTHTPNWLLVSGADPGATVWLTGSTHGLGSTGPISALGGLSLDVQPPLLGRIPFTADAQGYVSTSIQIPSSLPIGTPLALQAVVRRGPNGSQSYKSDVVELVVDHCGTIRVGVLPGYPGGTTHPLDSSLLFWSELEARADAYDFGCWQIDTVAIPSGFQLSTLLAYDVDTIWTGAAAGGQIAYAGHEVLAITSFLEDGYGGAVATGTFRWSTYDNRTFASVFGVDGYEILDYTFNTSPTVSLLQAGHPLAAVLPSSFDLLDSIVSTTTGLQNTLADAVLTTDASRVMQGADGIHGVIARETPDFRTAWFTGIPEVFNDDNPDAMQAAYNAIVWTAGR